MSTKVLTNPLKQLQKYGQSVWLDYIRRSLITSGELKRLIDEDGLRGITSNPSIFEKAIGGSTDYVDLIESYKAKARQEAATLTPAQLYEKLAIKDIQEAADILHSVYLETNRRDGYVSLEVSPLLANDTTATLKEAQRLWQAVGRENVMIKVPGTEAGIPAVKELISNGININITLLFSQATYEKVVEAFISGLEDLNSKDGDLSKVASVASFFISRIDTDIDNMINVRLKNTQTVKEKAVLENLLGKVAIANGKLTYQRYQEIFSSARWQKLAQKGAQTQRVLWASTSTKNPSYPDTLYVDQLIGPDTVNTIPPATFDAFRDHGNLSNSLLEHVDDAKRTMEQLESVNISMVDVTDNLVVQGVKLFADAFEKLLSTVEKQLKAEKQPAIARFSYKLPDHLAAKCSASLKQWQEKDNSKKLWAREASLWTGSDEGKWLDWLTVTNDQLAHLDSLKKLAQEIQKAGFKHAVLLGMGGSSLCTEVLASTFGTIAGFPKFHVLDSTDPAQIKALESQIDLPNTIFIVSSKSGNTLEPNIFKAYFFKRVSEKVGTEKAGDRFIAITDPGSQLDKEAQKDHFRHIFYGIPGIGGRYSALSNFGIVPGTIMGIDIAKFLDSTEEMVHACAASVPLEQNPGIILGTILGVLAQSGRDKVTLIASPAISDIGAWLEQLLAESTGKQGRGIIPIDREKLGPPDVYGEDRVFIYLRVPTDANTSDDQAVEALERVGQPVIRITVPDIYQLGQEFFRFEIATATAGSIIGINPFDQPDVEASKIATRQLTTEYDTSGLLPAETPLFEGNGLKLFTDKRNSDDLTRLAGSERSLTNYLRAHINRLKIGDYFALLAYIEMSDAHTEQLQEMRHLVRNHKRAATCLGFGPRFLHSTGQAYKGGPNTGVFLQITADDANDIEVPGHKYTFGVVKAAQARGDFQVLAERSRRALRVHLGPDTITGLSTLKSALKQALD